MEGAEDLTEEILSDDSWWEEWRAHIEEYGGDTGNAIVSLLLPIYIRFTMFNVAMFVVKYIPTTIYMYRFMKDTYKKTRSRMHQKQLELEEIKIQIEIINSKMCVHAARHSERSCELRRAMERLRSVRARVRHVMATEEHARGVAEWEDTAAAGEMPDARSYEEVEEFIKCLLKDFRCEDLNGIYERDGRPDGFLDQCNCKKENSAGDPETSVYSTISDEDTSKKDCHVKIIKVTNVYKVAYLKNYIKQKRLRRANKHALLEKKMESIKKLLEDWQTTLNNVLNTKLRITLDPSQLDHVSQEAMCMEAMGDYSKTNCSETDSDIKINEAYEDTNLNWDQSRYPYPYEDMRDCARNEPVYDTSMYNSSIADCLRSHVPANVLFVLPEETSSQLAIEEVKSDCGDG
ncbi:uncharacterized protein LOC105389288 isoform X1 [Plutella xylostella]|uniref:uncharacterized protein LOC105389288 isoform X1 n=1 Tax=Plutella xylostella TaxID=51655 RepID=UPI002032B995|nr:uncharacterized protein LOC105389288 isoform X1 [Plutella xylostella]